MQVNKMISSAVIGTAQFIVDSLKHDKKAEYVIWDISDNGGGSGGITKCSKSIRNFIFNKYFKMLVLHGLKPHDHVSFYNQNQYDTVKSCIVEHKKKDGIISVRRDTLVYLGEEKVVYRYYYDSYAIITVKPADRVFYVANDNFRSIGVGFAKDAADIGKRTVDDKAMDVFMSTTASYKSEMYFESICEIINLMEGNNIDTWCIMGTFTKDIMSIFLKHPSLSHKCSVAYNGSIQRRNKVYQKYLSYIIASHNCDALVYGGTINKNTSQCPVRFYTKQHQYQNIGANRFMQQKLYLSLNYSNYIINRIIKHWW